MSLYQTLQKTLEEWKEISHLDFCLLTTDEEIYLTTANRRLPASKKIQEFLKNDSIVSLANTSSHLYKILLSDTLKYILIVWGEGPSAHTIGELAVCQIATLLEASREKTDKNVFMQNLLLENYAPMDIFNRAKKLHISTSCRRAVFIIETKQAHGEDVITMVKNIFSARTKDFITTLNDQNVVLVRELQSTDSQKTLRDTARMLVDMLNMEAMTKAWVSYSNPVDELVSLPSAYKEAMTALEVGKIFYSDKNTFGYSQPGIGRLIYQLPVSVCEMFIDEIFKKETLDSLDEESLITIKTFFENNLNLSETSRKLYVHRNTLVYRFEKLEKKFGLDIRTFEDALTFKLAMLVCNYIKYKK